VTTGVPVAVAPSVKSPGLYLLINLLAGNASPGTSPLKGLVISPKSSSGLITADTELVEGVGGEDDAKTIYGPGTPGHLAAKAIFAEAPLALIDAVAPAASAGASATGKFTFAAGAPTVSWDVTANICGRDISIVWAAGESNADGATKLKNAINVLTNDLPVTATTNVGECIVTAKIAGLWGNDIKISVVAKNGATGTVTASGTVLASGTQEPSLTNVLALVIGKEYDFITLCTSNTDAVSAAASNVLAVKTHISGLDEGRNAKLQQFVYGCTDILANTKTGVAAMNFGPAECVQGEAFRSLGCEIGGAEMGARMREEQIDPACNRIEMPYKATLYGAANIAADQLTEAEVESALNVGVTPLTYNATGEIMPSRPITTYHKDSSGNADDRLLDTSCVSGTYAVAKDLRVALPREFPNAKLSDDIPAGEEPPPVGVVEVRDVKAFINERIQFWITSGVVQKQAYLDAYTAGTFIVRVNPSDDTQCDVVLPISIVPPLAKFSVVVNRVPT